MLRCNAASQVHLVSPLYVSGMERMHLICHVLGRARQMLQEFADDETQMSRTSSRNTTLTPVC